MKTSDLKAGLRESAGAVGIVALATALCLALRAHLATVDVAMVLLLAVVAGATRYRRGPALLAAVASIGAFDFFFVPPYYTFSVHDTAYFLTFGVMLVVAMTMSRLTARIREQREAAADRERRTAALYAMESDLAAATSVQQLREAAAEHLGRVATGRAILILAEELGDARAPAWPSDPAFDEPTTRIAATWAWTRGEATGWGTPHGREVPAMLAPLSTHTGRLGLAVVVPDDPHRDLPDNRSETLFMLVGLAAAAIERRLLAEQNERGRTEVEAERLRTALLSSLSHDMRTPLASIEGSASALLEDSGALSADIRRELLDSILQESQRMTRLVGNLLDMIRVETGTLAVQKSWQPLEEALGVALLRMEDSLRSHPVSTRIPSDLPLVPIDELLVEQVLLNLLENAVRHTPPGTPIEISARRDDSAVLVEVADHGPGVPAGEEVAVFERFHRAAARSADAGAGSGLGLTICQGIITAHGGHIWIESRSGGGAAVRFTLPLAGPPAAPIPAELAPR